MSSLEKQIGKFLARIAENLPEMSVDERQGWIENPKGLQKFLLGLCPPAEAPECNVEQLLRNIATVAVIGAKKFVAKSAIKEANIGWTSNNFEEFFLGNVEEDVADITVAIHRLEQSSLNAQIMAQLGDRAEIRLTHLLELIKKQSEGERGFLLTNSYANIAYIKGNDGNLWAVFAYWSHRCGDWRVSAQSIWDPDGWEAGCQVISRDC